MPSYGSIPKISHGGSSSSNEEEDNAHSSDDSDTNDNNNNNNNDNNDALNNSSAIESSVLISSSSSSENDDDDKASIEDALSWHPSESSGSDDERSGLLRAGHTTASSTKRRSRPESPRPSSTPRIVWNACCAQGSDLWLQCQTTWQRGWQIGVAWCLAAKTFLLDKSTDGGVFLLLQWKQFQTYINTKYLAFATHMQGGLEPLYESQLWSRLVAAWSHLVFHWFTPVLHRGNERNKLEREDMELVPFPQDCDTQGIVENFTHHWNRQFVWSLQHQQQKKNKARINTTNHNNNHPERTPTTAGTGEEEEVQQQQNYIQENDNTTNNTDNADASNTNNNNKPESPLFKFFITTTTSTTTTAATPSLAMALMHSFGNEFLKAGILKLGHDSCLFVGPQVLNAMIYYLRDAGAPRSRGLALTLAVTCSQLTMSFCLRHYFFNCFVVGLKVRTAVVVAVYQKALVLAAGERQTRTVGEITNLMSIDAKRLQDLISYLHAIWYTLFQISLALFFLWQQLGASCLGGVVVMLIMMPVTKYVANWMGTLQKQVMKAKDQRVEINSEVMSNMKIIKTQAWEESFQAKILTFREAELAQIWEYYLANAASMMLWGATPVVVAVATFAAYVLSGNKLEVASALTSLTLFDILRFPLFMLPEIINRIVEANVSLSRIQSFLLCQEHQQIPPGSLEKNGVDLSNVSAAYESKKPRMDGTDVDAQVKDIIDAQWEAALLQSQLNEAERKIEDLQEEMKAKLHKAKQRREQLLVLLSTNPDDSGEDEWEDLKQEDTMEAVALDPSIDPSSGGSTTALQPVTGGMDIENKPSNNLLCLKRIDFKCKQGQLIAVVGVVGSGKSSLINTILGEIRIVSGTSAVRGRVSYFAQAPFILNATVRDNILFGHAKDGEIDEARYQRALKCCALEHDLKMLSHSDLTEIGERGVTLSGGQKARLALARCVYEQADISLIDDALSAVDAHVAKHLFHQCIVDELMSGKNGSRSVILVTNALQFLRHPRVNKIVVVNDGRIAEQGTFMDLAKKPNSLFGRLLTVVEETAIKPTDLGDDNIPMQQEIQRVASVDSQEENEELDLDVMVDDTLTESPARRRRSSIQRLSEEVAVNAGSDDPVKTTMLMTEETSSTGHVSKDVYLAWAKAAGGYQYPVAMVVLFCFVEGINVLSKWWLTYWSSHASRGTQTEFLVVYSGINALFIISSFFSVVLLLYIGLKASQSFFTQMLDTMMKTPLSFFDTNPIGRIINRFSKDMYTIDEELVMTFRSYIRCLSGIVSTVLVISGVSPIFTICLIPIIWFYIKEQQFFTVTFRELKRLDSVNRSPLYALLGETVEGVATIRAFSAQDAMVRRLKSFLDTQQHAYFLTVAAQCWLAVRLEMIGTLIIAFACLCAVLEHGAVAGNETKAGLFGLAISFSLSITQTLNWSVRMASDFEAQMVAVERVKDYCEVPSEAARHCSGDNDLLTKKYIDEGISTAWPSGEIKFVAAKLRYRPGLPLVLKGLDITIPAGSKVGVVGRTGAGKSTLMVALLRLVELDSGKILIDGVDARSIGLAVLRSKIAVIPQDPVLFSGTIRTNLDPFGQHPEGALYGVLYRVGLYHSAAATNHEYSSTSLSSMVSSCLVQSLEDPVSEGGINLSQGQRQLVVIARALLCGASIVIMDEATASVDAGTDARIQTVMRTEFVSATCITVAHRLNTIMDSDYILVMDDGQAAEFDKPNVLLQKQGGMFRDLVQANANTGIES